MIPKIKQALDFLEERTKYYLNMVKTEQTILKRTVGVGVLPPKDAVDLCAVGPTLRASGIKNDVRADDPYAAYGEIPFNVITHDKGDVFSRMLVRVEEMLESVNMTRHALDYMPAGTTRVKVPMAVPKGEAVSRVEAPRGELIHYVKSNGTTKPERYKVRSPTLGNIPAVCKTLMGGHLADVPIILAGIDPCFSCMDRMALVDVKTDKHWVWTMQELKRHTSK
jgi:NADH-quinone oxidoreductase subunit D